MDFLRILVTNKLSVLPGVEGVHLAKDLPLLEAVSYEQLANQHGLARQLLLSNSNSSSNNYIENNNYDDLDTDHESDENENDSSRVSLNDSLEDSSFQNHLIFGILYFILILLGFYLVSQLSSKDLNEHEEDNDMRINFDYVDEIYRKYPNLMTPKKIRLIKARLAMMQKEVSILMLIGRARDSHCNLDPTFCIGQTLANVTQKQFGYIDASNPAHSDKIEHELSNSLNGQRDSVMIDCLERLPGTRVMNLFQFIDKDETSLKKGMLLFVIYIGDEQSGDTTNITKEVALAEKILTDKWSPFVPMDSLNSVISRITGSILKLY